MQRSVASLVAMVALTGTVWLSAQTTSPKPAEPSALEAPLTNDDIVRLTRAGLSPDLIVMKIRQAPDERLDVSTDAIVALHDQEVSDVVIAAAFERVAKRPPSTPLATASVTPALAPARGSPATVPPGRGPKPFPDLELVRAGGGSIRLSQLRGKIIMIIVWATWNGPSAKELPIIQTIADRYRDGDLVVISVNVDTDPGPVEHFMKKLNVSLPLYRPLTADASVLMAGGLPATLILERDRTLVDRTVGYYPEWEARWNQVLEKYLRP